MKKILLATAALLLAASSAFAGSHSMKIGYITKSATNAGWVMINGGAAKAAEEEGVELISVGPSFQGDLASQLEVFNNLVASGIDAIGIAPVDSSGVAEAVQAAMDAGIPVVAIDTGVSGADVTSFVATDNLAVAKIQGMEACKLITNGDAIIYVTGNQAQSTGQERRDGFMEGFKSGCGDSEIVTVPTEWNGTQAQEGVAAVLATRSDIAMVANAWDGGTMGAKAALENAGYSAGDVKLVGFDGAGDAIVAMDAGWVHVDTAQMLEAMGYEGIKAAVAAANGEDVSPRIDTGTFLVTPETSDEYKALIGM